MKKEYEFVYGQFDESKTVDLDFVSAQEQNGHLTVYFTFYGKTCKRLPKYSGREIIPNRFDWLVNDRMVSTDYHVWLEKKFHEKRSSWIVEKVN